MPYLTTAMKQRLDDIICRLVMTELTTAGQLNYLFTKIAMRYLVCHDESYQTYNDIMGALENAQFELYRRKIAGYEDLKIKENGDVF